MGKRLGRRERREGERRKRERERGKTETEADRGEERVNERGGERKWSQVYLGLNKAAISISVR